jgi:hypothetical protein
MINCQQRRSAPRGCAAKRAAGRAGRAALVIDKRLRFGQVSARLVSMLRNRLAFMLVVGVGIGLGAGASCSGTTSTVGKSPARAGENIGSNQANHDAGAVHPTVTPAVAVVSCKQLSTELVGKMNHDLKLFESLSASLRDQSLQAYESMLLHHCSVDQWSSEARACYSNIDAAKLAKHDDPCAGLLSKTQEANLIASTAELGKRLTQAWIKAVTEGQSAPMAQPPT